MAPPNQLDQRDSDTQPLHTPSSSPGQAGSPPTAERPQEQPDSSSGIFRQVLVEWFAGTDIESALQRAGRLINRALSQIKPLTEVPLDARVQAITADLEFLAHFLISHVDTRQYSSLEPEDWELAQVAGHAGAQLLVLRENLLSDVELPPAQSVVPHRLEDFLGCRETSLLLVASSGDAKALRQLTALIGGYAREVHVLENGLTCSATRRDAHAALVDLLHLSNFVLETADLAGRKTAAELLKLSSYVTGAARKLLEAGGFRLSGAPMPRLT